MADTIFVAGGSAKANANFGPGLYEMESWRVSQEEKVKPEWRIAGKMSEGRSFLGSAAVDGRVFMIGGCLNEDYSTTEVWDPDTGTFQYIAKSLGKRDSQGQAVIDGEIYVVGGYDNIKSRYLKSLEKFSPQSNKWTKLPSMNLARRSPGVVNYRNRLFAVGGMGEEDDLSSVEVFCPTSGDWRYLPAEMKEVNGWCSACLVEKPVRMMVEERLLSKQKGPGCQVDWEDTGPEMMVEGAQAGQAGAGNKNW